MEKEIIEILKKELRFLTFKDGTYSALSCRMEELPRIAKEISKLQKQESQCDRNNNLDNNRCINCGAKAGHPCRLDNIYVNNERKNNTHSIDETKGICKKFMWWLVGAEQGRHFESEWEHFLKHEKLGINSDWIEKLESRGKHDQIKPNQIDNTKD